MRSLEYIVLMRLISDRFLEADEGEETTEFTQGDIASVVDIASAQKVGNIVPEVYRCTTVFMYVCMNVHTRFFKAYEIL